jgi:hypothetical protein
VKSGGGVRGWQQQQQQQPCGLRAEERLRGPGLSVEHGAATPPRARSGRPWRRGVLAKAGRGKARRAAHHHQPADRAGVHPVLEERRKQAAPAPHGQMARQP